MGEMAGSAAGESPLVPNRTMQRMYEGMVESRMLVDLLRSRSGKPRVQNVRGQEACRASALIDLTPDDFVSDSSGILATAFLRGADLQVLLTSTDTASGKKKKLPAFHDVPGLLPAVKDTTARLQLALGVALAARRLKPSTVVVIFVGAAELKPSLLREHLRFSAQETLPILFVVLPASKPSKAPEPFVVSAKATADGVPGIPVDASDAIALYRVAQESLGRSRAGGGPALMECIPFIAAPSAPGYPGRPTPTDPIEAMGAMLLRRKVCSEDWLHEVAPAFQARLDAL